MKFQILQCESESQFFGGPMEIVKFVSFVVRLVLMLALCGQLKFCTLVMLGKASEKTQKGMISYSKYTKALLQK